MSTDTVFNSLHAVCTKCTHVHHVLR